MTTQQARALEQGVEKLGLNLAPGTESRLLDYLALLQKWNRVYNLTAIREAPKLVSHHLLDSLAVVPHLAGGAIVDIGTGPGLPGIPLALARPDWQVTLVDSNHKKTAFVTQAVGELNIANAEVRRERVEQWRPAATFQVVISRAFAELADFVRLAGHLLAPGGRLAAMKGLNPHEEIAQLPEGFRVERVVPLAVPGVEGERHLVLIERTAA
ncbi:MAG: 16S rRNA (guanine(527)-N(7))-methyltransferase RsmG [Burkholderiales bacterium]|nr:16S rRNA (guanine(527)-N(7))-methyltransferase RsmG [Burkholderiales bacterium]